MASVIQLGRGLAGEPESGVGRESNLPGQQRQLCEKPFADFAETAIGVEPRRQGVIPVRRVSAPFDRRRQVSPAARLMHRVACDACQRGWLEQRAAVSGGCRPEVNQMRAAFFLALILALATAQPAQAGGVYYCDDVNGTGQVTSADALLVLRHAVGLPVEIMCPPAGQPLKTGQTTCYEPSGYVSGVIDCDGTRQDGELQEGVAHEFHDIPNGTIVDDGTGLQWEKLSDDGLIHDKDNGYTWSDTSTLKIAALNSMAFAGFDDWRLPNRFELETLVHLEALPSTTWPEFEQDCAPGCTNLTCSCTAGSTHAVYWSSTSYVIAPSNAWVVNMNDGRAYPDVKTLAYGVRAVRGPVVPD